MDRRDLVLALLAAAGGAPYTPVQIQKAAFLVSKQLQSLIEGRGFNFAPYDYGPFDADVYDEARALATMGDVEVAPGQTGKWSTYATTASGQKRGEAILANLSPDVRQYLTQVAAWVRSQSFSSLVKSIYQAYPDMKVNSVFRG